MLVSHLNPHANLRNAASTGVECVDKEAELLKFKQKAIKEEENIKNRQQTTIIENFLIKERGMQHVSEFNPLSGH